MTDRLSVSERYAAGTEQMWEREQVKLEQQEEEQERLDEMQWLSRQRQNQT